MANSTYQLGIMLRRMRTAKALLLYRLFGELYLRLQGIRPNGRTILWGFPIIRIHPKSHVTWGHGCTFVSDSRFTPLGVHHPLIMRTLQAGAVLRLGDRVGFSGGTVCAAKRIEIGDDSIFGANVTIMDTDFHNFKPDHRTDESTAHNRAQPICIGQNVFVGTGAIILKGVTIGDNSVIGAGSVVTKSIPANVIAAGNPCRVIKPLPAGGRPVQDGPGHD